MLTEIIFNDISSTTFSGLRVKYQAFPVLPAKRTTTEYVLGKDGGYTFEDRYDNKQIGLEFIIHNNNAVARRALVNQLVQWLSVGEAKLILGIEPTVYYDATVVTELSSALLFYEDKFLVVFDCKPVKKYTQESVEGFSVSGTMNKEIDNLGTYDSLPIIKLVGAATTLTLTDGYGNTFTYSRLSGTVYIDCEDLVVYSISGSNKVNRMNNFSGSFLRLKPGDNTIAITGSGFSGLSIEFKFRYSYL